MKRLIFVALGMAVLSGCTGTHIKPPPVCDGKHRRPANLYGTILPSLPVPLPQSQAQSKGQGQSMLAPPPAGEPPAPAPENGGPPAAPDPGGANAPPSAPHTSARDIARSYTRC